MSNLFSAGSSKARRLSALSTLAVSALLFSACASENSTAQSSSSATSSASASANASSTQSSSAAGAQASSSRSSDQGASDASPSAGAETTSSDGQKLEEIYTGAEDMKKASPVPTDNSEVKKTTELVNSYENILSTVKPAPSAAASPEATSEPTSDQDAQEQNVEKARAVLDEDTIHAIENISVDSAAAEFAVQASEYAMAGITRVPPPWWVRLAWPIRSTRVSLHACWKCAWTPRRSKFTMRTISPLRTIVPPNVHSISTPLFRSTVSGKLQPTISRITLIARD